MAYRKFSRARSFTRAPQRRRSGINWQKADRPRKWQAGNFFTVQNTSLPNTSDTSVNVAVLLARTQNIGNTATGEGRAMGELVRRVEIGGVVISFGHFITAPFDLTIGVSPQTYVPYVQNSLVVDRLDATGAPIAAATASWQRPQVPVVAISATTPGAAVEDVDFPTRTLWRHCEPAHTWFMDTVNGISTHLYASNNSQIAPASRALNKRLRLPLDDEHGLFFCWSLLAPADYTGGASKGFRLWCSGTVYYRVVIGR